MNVKLKEGAFMPVRAHEADAGYDLRTPVDFVLRGGFSGEQGCVVIDTGVCVQIPIGYVGFLKSKSGLNVKNGITGEGVIDSGYTGSIVAKLYNATAVSKEFKRGDKIIQLVLLPIFTPELVQVDSLDSTERGDNGFGSTGR